MPRAKTIEYKGTTKTLGEWSVIMKISEKTLYDRIFKYNWQVKDAMETPVRARRKNYDRNRPCKRTTWRECLNCPYSHCIDPNQPVMSGEGWGDI